MINEDILTSLKNAIERGETLQTAVIIAINTGYNPREVEEAARFLGQGGVIEIEKISQEQLLAMPDQKKVLPNLFAPRKTGTFVPAKTENTTVNATQPSTSTQSSSATSQSSSEKQLYSTTKPSTAQSLILPEPTASQQTIKYSQQDKIIPQQVRPLPQQPQPAKPQPPPIKPQVQPPAQLRPLPESQTITEIKKNIAVTRQERIDPNPQVIIRPPKPSYVKEIILLIILLLLIVVLVVVFKFRDQIITFFSG